MPMPQGILQKPETPFHLFLSLHPLAAEDTVRVELEKYGWKAQKVAVPGLVERSLSNVSIQYKPKLL